MIRSPLPRLQDIIEASAQLNLLTKGRTLDQLATDWGFRMACQHGVLIIAEAANGLPPDLRDRYPEVPWRNIITMGHKLRHEYFRIDVDILWDAVTNHLPALERTVRRMIADISQPAMPL